MFHNKQSLQSANGSAGGHRRLVRLLEECGLSQAKFAERMGIHPTTVSRWGDDVPTWAFVYLGLLAQVKSLAR